MKYKLKKDLPFAKAGIEVRFQENTGYLPSFELRNINDKNQWVVMVGNKGHWNEYIGSGWIEEVKPREWYIGLTKNDLPCYVGEGKPYEDKVHYNFLSSINNEFELIKVREVIE